MAIWKGVRRRSASARLWFYAKSRSAISGYHQTRRQARPKLMSSDKRSRPWPSSPWPTSSNPSLPPTKSSRQLPGSGPGGQGGRAPTHEAAVPPVQEASTQVLGPHWDRGVLASPAMARIIRVERAIGVLKGNSTIDRAICLVFTNLGGW